MEINLILIAPNAMLLGWQYYNHEPGFEFNEIKQCERLSNLYWNKKAIGNIAEYENSKQALISMIRNKR